MADREHFALLNDGPDAWNARRQEMDFVADLTDADFSNREFVGFNFSNCIFVGSNFAACRISDCDFTNSIFGASPQYSPKGAVFVSIGDHWKNQETKAEIEKIKGLGFSLFATRGTADWLKAKANLKTEIVNKVYEGRPNIDDMLKDRDFAAVVSFTQGRQAIEDSNSNRLLAVGEGIPLVVSWNGLQRLVGALETASQERDSEKETSPQKNTSGCDFSSSVFIETNVEGAIFDNCDFSRADLRGATGLTDQQIADCSGSFATMLPQGVSRPVAWEKADRGTSTTEKVIVATSVKKNAVAIDLNVSMLLDQVNAEIDYLLSNLPNDPIRLSDYRRQINFLKHLSGMLNNLEDSIEDENEAAGLIVDIRDEVELWFSQNRAELIDTAIRVPAMAGSIGLLGLAGASMGPATIAAIALIGGPKVVGWYKKMKSEK